MRPDPVLAWLVAAAIAAGLGSGPASALAQTPASSAPALIAMTRFDADAAIPLAAEAEDEAESPVVFNVAPSAEPVPALRYTLLPRRNDLGAGNAAIYYHRAMQVLSDRSQPPNPKPDDWKSLAFEIGEWATADPDAFPRDRATALFRDGSLAPILDEIDLGSRQVAADWGLRNRKHAIRILLPEVQNARNLGRLIALKARVETLDGHFDAALADLQDGYVLARHVGTDSPMIIQALVGIAIAGQMNQKLEDLIRSPGAPNLYWMLANRPRPLIRMADAVEGERDVLESEIPGLRTVDGPAWTIEQSRQFADELLEFFPMASGGPAVAVPAGRAGVAALVASAYPKARQALIDEGRIPEQVDAMPTLQVAAIHAYRRYLRFRDDLAKPAGLPYWQAVDVAKRLEAQLFGANRRKLDDPLATLFELLVPALNATRSAEIRIERHFDALQTVEALRLHAAAHDGKLPASLADLDGFAPAPLDPATGQPFVYRRETDTTALLTAPTFPNGPDHPTSRINYRIELRTAATPNTETPQP